MIVSFRAKRFSSYYVTKTNTKIRHSQNMYTYLHTYTHTYMVVPNPYLKHRLIRSYFAHWVYCRNRKILKMKKRQ